LKINVQTGIQSIRFCFGRGALLPSGN